LALGSTSHIIYGNYFSARESGIGYTHRATTAMQITASAGLVFDANTLETIRHAVRLYGYSGEGSSLSGTNAPGVNYFSYIADNTVNGTARGFQSDVFNNKGSSYPIAPGDAFNLGNVFRSNTVSGITYLSAFAFNNSFTANSVYGINVLDNNSASGFGSVRYADTDWGSWYYAKPLVLDPLSSDLVLIGNSFSGNASITGLSATNVVVQGNSWSGFEEPYAQKYPKFSIPQLVSLDGSVRLQNTGTSELTWTSPAFGSGTIAPEQSVEITDLDEGTYVIESGGQTRTVEVTRIVQAAGANIKLTLSGYDGMWVKAEVHDVILDTFLEQGPWYAPTQVMLDVPTNRYNVYIKTSGEVTGPYSLDRTIVEPPK
jgi:hypothetical protein